MQGTEARPTPSWSTWRELPAVITYPRHLRKTLTVVLCVGTAFFVMNQLGVIISGHAMPLVWFKAALTYLTPFCMSNFGIASATQRRREE